MYKKGHDIQQIKDDIKMLKDKLNNMIRDKENPDKEKEMLEISQKLDKLINIQKG